MTLLMSGGLTIIASAVVFLLVTMVLVGALLYAKAKLVPSGNVKLTVNGEKEIETPMGGTLLGALQSAVYSCHLPAVAVVSVVNAVLKC